MWNVKKAKMPIYTRSFFQNAFPMGDKLIHALEK